VEILLIENRSTDGTMALLRPFQEQGATIVQCGAQTAGQARNIGADRAAGRILCFLDADVVIGPSYLAEARNLFSRPWIGAAGCTVELPTSTWIERVWGQLHAQRHWRINALLNGANFCVRRERFKRVGGFDPVMQTGEDHEICLRLLEAGETLVESPALAAIHLDNPVTVRAFFAKERWRGLGAFGTARRNRVDKPLFMTILYLASIATAFGNLVGSGASLGGFVSAFALTSLVPVLAVAYRWAQADTPVGFLQAAFLYHLYFLARALALLDILAGRHRAASPPAS
jgi:GT2 family glycosyltransferase